MTNPFDLTNKRILITGASSGIGRATAQLVSQLNGKVIATGRDHKRLESTMTSLEGKGHVCRSFDLTEVDSISEWMLDLASGGRLDGLVHMAGIHGVRPLKVTDAAFVNQILNVNITTAIGLARGLRHKKVRGSNSSIVFASSVAAIAGEAGISAYSASKGAIISLTRSLAIELAREKIRVNCVSPSIVKTEMTEKFQELFTPEQLQAVEDKHPLGTGEPVDVANLVAFLLSDASRWMTGSNIVIDGGYSAQ